MLDAFKYSVKFEQIDIINHFKNTSKNNFSKKIIGVDNMKSLQDGICYGLTNSFLYYAHANQEEIYVTETYNAYKNIKKIKLVDFLKDTYHYKAFKKHSEALLNQNFNKARNIQNHHNMIYFLRDILNKFNKIKKEYNEDDCDYINRLFQKNTLSIKEDEKHLYLELHEFINKVYHDALNPPLKLEKNRYNNLVSDVSSKCFQNESEIDSLRFPLFFSLVKDYYLELTKERLTQLENIQNIHYDSITSIDFDITFTSKELKAHIEDCLIKKKDIIGNLCSQTHSMGIVVKYRNGKPIFEFFEPNKGLFKTTDKSHFFNFLDALFNDKSYKFEMRAKTEEKTVSLSSSLAANQTFNYIQAPRIDERLVNQDAKALRMKSSKLKHHRKTI